MLIERVPSIKILAIIRTGGKYDVLRENAASGSESRQAYGMLKRNREAAARSFKYMSFNIGPVFLSFTHAYRRWIIIGPTFFEEGAMTISRLHSN